MFVIGNMKKITLWFFIGVFLSIGLSAIAAPSSVNRLTDHIEPLITGDFIRSQYFVATSTTATSTFAGGFAIDTSDFVVDPDAGRVGIGTTSPASLLSVHGNGYFSGTGFFGGAITGTSTLNIVGGVDFDTFTSALLLTGAGGDIAEYAGTTCTNQFVRILSALGAATCADVGTADITDGVVLEADLSLLDAPADEDILTSEGTGFEWHTGAELCVAITGGAGLCDGTDATGAGGGSGNVATSTGETIGYVPFWTSTAATPATVGADSQFFWDNTGKRLGIGTTTPAWLFHVASSSASSNRPQFAITDTVAGVNLKHWTLASQGGNLYFATSTDLYATSTTASLSIIGAATNQS